MSTSARKTKINARQLAVALVAMIDEAGSALAGIAYFQSHHGLAEGEFSDRVLPKAASMLIARHSFADAYALINHGLLEDPRNPYLLTVRGKLQWKQGDLDGAQATYESIPTHVPARNSLARLVQERGETDRAQMLYEETLLMTNENNVVALNGLAKILLGQGGPTANARAQELLERSLELKWQDNDARDIAQSAGLELDLPIDALNTPHIRLV